MTNECDAILIVNVTIFETAGVKQESGHQGNLNTISHTEPHHGGTQLSFAQYAYSTDHCQYTGGVPAAALSSLDSSPSSHHHHRAGLVDVEPDSQHILHSLVSLDPVFLGAHQNVGTQFCLNKISKVSPQPACKPANAHQPAAHLSGFSPSSVEHKSFGSYPSGANDTSLSNASWVSGGDRCCCCCCCCCCWRLKWLWEARRRREGETESSGPGGFGFGFGSASHWRWRSASALLRMRRRRKNRRSLLISQVCSDSNTQPSH